MHLKEKGPKDLSVAVKKKYERSWGHGGNAGEILRKQIQIHSGGETRAFDLVGKSDQLCCPGFQTHKLAFSKKETCKLDPVGLTVRYEMMELCTGSEKDKIVGTWWYWVSKRRYRLNFDGTWSVYNLYIERSGNLVRLILKERAT